MLLNKNLINIFSDEANERGAIIAGACIGGLLSVAAFILAFYLYRCLSHFKTKLYNQCVKLSFNMNDGKTIIKVTRAVNYNEETKKLLFAVIDMLTK